MKVENVSKRKILIKSLISFVLFVAFFGGVYFLWNQLKSQPTEKGVPKTLRRTLSFNENLAIKTFDPNKKTPTFNKEQAAKNVRVNGAIGMKNAKDTLNYTMKIVRMNGDTLKVTLADLKKLPKTEVIFNFKCIEGWSQISHWGGVKFSDFIKHYHLEKESKLNFVALSTPDEKYYVGIDRNSIMHSQTILAYQLNEKPLPLNQGYPIRLIIPVKYGVKHLKRIGNISFSNDPPKDYWYEQGYDYYCGF